MKIEVGKLSIGSSQLKSTMNNLLDFFESHLAKIVHHRNMLNIVTQHIVIF